MSNYPGKIHFSSKDLQAALPADTTLVSGQGTFSVTLKTAIDSNITVNDVAKPTTKGSLKFPVSVFAGSASALKLSTVTLTTVNVKRSVVVSAVDAFGNLDPNYRGTVTLSSSDVLAGLPGAYTFTAKDAGKHTFTVTFKTIGLYNLVATAGSLHATQSNIVVAGTTTTIGTQTDLEAGTTLDIIGTSASNAITVQPSSVGDADGSDRQRSQNIWRPRDMVIWPQ